jgi:hypothetical protein
MVATVRAKLAILLATCVSFTSYTAMLVVPYDATTDNLLTELSVKTETAIASAGDGQVSPRGREKFFDGSIGAVRTMKARSSFFARGSLGQMRVPGAVSLELAALRV